jgi:hypothetical protein
MYHGTPSALFGEASEQFTTSFCEHTFPQGWRYGFTMFVMVGGRGNGMITTATLSFRSYGDSLFVEIVSICVHFRGLLSIGVLMVQLPNPIT